MLKKIMAGVIAGALCVSAMVTMAAAANPTYLAALFNGLKSGETYNLKVDFKVGDTQGEVDWASTGYLAIVGAAGYKDFTVSDVKLVSGGAAVKIEVATIDGGGDQKWIELVDDLEDGKSYTLTFTVKATGDGNIRVRTNADGVWENWTDQAGSKSSTVDVPAAKPATGGTATGGDGKEADTGAEGVAVLFGVAIIATGAVVMSRKKR